MSLRDEDEAIPLINDRLPRPFGTRNDKNLYYGDIPQSLAEKKYSRETESKNYFLNFLSL